MSCENQDCQVEAKFVKFGFLFSCFGIFFLAVLAFKFYQVKNQLFMKQINKQYLHKHAWGRGSSNLIFTQKSCSNFRMLIASDFAKVHLDKKYKFKMRIWK